MKALSEMGYNGDLAFEIFRFIEGFPDELIENALKFAVSVGRYLISLAKKKD